MKLTKEMKQALSERFDSAGYSSKSGAYIIKRRYFDRHGDSAEKLAERVKAFFSQTEVEIEVTEVRDHFNSWPKDSWFEVRFTVKDSCGGDLTPSWIQRIDE